MKQTRSPDAFGTICHHPWSDGDDQMLQDTGDGCCAFACPLPCRDVRAQRCSGSCCWELSPPITAPDDVESLTLFPRVWYAGHQTHRLAQPAVAPRKGQRGARGGAHAAQAPADPSEDAGCSAGPLLALPHGAAALLQVTQWLIKSSFPLMLS